MDENDVIRKYAEAHGCDEKDIIRKSDGDGKYELYMDYFKSYGITLDVEEKSTRPLPCVRDEHGEIREQTVKELLSKINEEIDELKAVIFYSCDVYDPNCLPESCDDMMHTRIAEEAADTITAITTMLEALCIDAEMRDEAQRRVNAKNRERGRL